ncbi:MAG: Asp-tRNA(Asn)/Glu-tRNA(Gln) amidotransferase subunit GatC [Phycisphaerales bacterium]|nr:Asp-tRNA(Asn)/Glu-tRNA(Gln) amidotransferase subunit GatC [Phycisphaerales bacterium]
MSNPLTHEQVRHVARLSRLKLSDTEVDTFAHQLSDILAYVEKLNQLNLDGVEPMAHALDLTNVLRADEPQPGLTVEAVLANAPASEPPFFLVPKVLDDGSGA